MVKERLVILEDILVKNLKKASESEEEIKRIMEAAKEFNKNPDKYTYEIYQYSSRIHASFFVDTRWSLFEDEFSIIKIPEQLEFNFEWF